MSFKDIHRLCAEKIHVFSDFLWNTIRDREGPSVKERALIGHFKMNFEGSQKPFYHPDSFMSFKAERTVVAISENITDQA
jgi:hypothetical protein